MTKGNIIVLTQLIKMQLHIGHYKYINGNVYKQQQQQKRFITQLLEIINSEGFNELKKGPKVNIYYYKVFIFKYEDRL